MDDQMFDAICYENIIIHLPLHTVYSTQCLLYEIVLRLPTETSIFFLVFLDILQFFLQQRGRGINLSSSVNDENATFNLTSCEHVVFTKVTVNFSNERNRKSFTIWEKRQCYYFISQIVEEIDLHYSALKNTAKILET